MAQFSFPSLKFDLGDTADAIRETVHAFSQNEIAPRAAEIDRSNQFPRDLWPKLGALGLHGISHVVSTGCTSSTDAIGYAASLIPVHHAWCVDAEDRVIDATWPEEGAAYMGIVFDPWELEGGKSVIDNWEDRWPLLRRSDG